MTTPFRLESSRLYIHRFEPTTEHADFLVKLYNTPLFIAGEGDTGINTTEKALRQIKDGFIGKAFAKNGHGPYLISLNDRTLIGSVTIMRGDYLAPDIGFALLPEYTKQGYAKEAGLRLIEYATQSKEEGGLGYPGVFVFTSNKNEKAKKLSESLGLEYRGVYPLQAFGGHPSAVYASKSMVEDLKVYGITEEKSE
ncbi:hypothetical protein CI109_100727 [Kwoniella shandongensis]|uniref:Uncharacterized protein n=1 Tax=Kwoniella shandongensis TaxID=1734106 RepID=A0A5M6BQC0_9TREE|nr:uncharacterized protein CI109_007394 [Kwoniella shandongensis]KAA5524271.1 hypothetical protein CI109_007394 [Kwoniella shandongensis]